MWDIQGGETQPSLRIQPPFCTWADCPRNRENFAIGKAHKGRYHQGRRWEPGVQGTGSRKIRSVPLPPPRRTQEAPVEHQCPTLHA